MLSEIGAGIGAYGGSQLGQMIDAPRSLAWQGAAGGAKGLADILNSLTGSNLDFGSGEAYGSGADMMSSMFGMNADDPMAQGLGVGAEMLLDPMTYLGGAIGKGAGALVGRGAEALGGAMRGASAIDKTGDAASLASRLERMAGSGSVPGQMMREGAAATQAADYGDAIGNLLNKQMPIEPYMEVAMSGADDAGRLSRRLEQAGTIPGGAAPRPEMPSALTPRGGAAGFNPRKASANERYLGDKAARIGDIESAIGSSVGPGSVSPGSFSGPFTPQVPGVGPDFLDQYGKYLAAGTVGGGAAGAYAMGQNR